MTDELRDGTGLPVVWAGWSGQVEVLVRGLVAVGDMVVPSGLNDGYATALAAVEPGALVIGTVESVEERVAGSEEGSPRLALVLMGAVRASAEAGEVWWVVSAADEEPPQLASSGASPASEQLVRQMVAKIEKMQLAHDAALETVQAQAGQIKVSLAAALSRTHTTHPPSRVTHCACRALRRLLYVLSPPLLHYSASTITWRSSLRCNTTPTAAPPPITRSCCRRPGVEA